MKNKSTSPDRRTKIAGFTLIELLVVVLIIGVLSATAVPQYFKLVEKSKVDEAVGLLNTLRASQQRYQSKYGVYCTGTIATCSGLDVSIPNLKYFSTPTTIQAGASPPSWKATLTRNSNTAVYGYYVLTYDVEPGAPPAMTCSQTDCSADLLPK